MSDGTSLPERFLVIGLDGADLDLVRPWMEAGELPHLSSVAEAGTACYLDSTIPPVSAPAWASFMTGRGPGRHGVYGFVTEEPGTGETLLVSLRSIRGTKLWEAFHQEGSKVAVVNVPITYPPPAVDGVFVSGMLSPPGRPFAHPETFMERIRSEAPGYRIDIDRGLFSERRAFLDHMHSMCRARGAVARLAMDEVPDWRLLVTVFTNTDRIQHHFWRKEKHEILSLYRTIDEEVGRILAAVDRERTLVLVMSDHGFTTTDRRFYANRWLETEGYLSLRRVGEQLDDYEQRRFNWFMGEPEEATRSVKWRARLLKRLGIAGDRAIDWRRTRAYVYTSDTRGIHVNLEGRQPLGTVPPSEYESLRDEIIGKLCALRFPETNEPVFELVARREDVYEGPYVDRAPDVMTVPQRDRYRFVTKIDSKRVFRQHRVPGGYHRRPGLLFAAGPGVKTTAEVEGAQITDILPTLLFAAGIGIPEKADGRVLRALFTEELLAAREEKRVAEAADASEESVDLTEEEDEKLHRMLRDLGYL